MSKDFNLTGAAGEHYVAFRLLAMNYAVALTPRGTTSIDMIVASLETGKTITMQTKTRKDAFSKRPSTWDWRVGRPRKPFASFFYAFVDLKNDPSQTPDVFIVPSREMRPKGVYPKEAGGDPESPKARDIWFGINEEKAPKYRNKWELIERALA
ncbi:MAG: hypothetical protein PHN78_02335 [Dehalococcoidales bacterium]|nr:hypothetical protein [Dehalococcoidales bacterium]